MTIYYSATTNAFYDSQVYNVNNIPEDKVAVAESTYKNLMAQQCAGRVIVAAADGTPTTIVQTCGPCTSTKYATKTELTNGLAAKANDSNVVHKTGDEHINGVKSFGSVIKATNGTVQVGADTGYSVTFNHNGNITSKQARGTYNIFFPEGSGTLALTSDINGKANDSDVVHKTGTETIAGVKTFDSLVYLHSNMSNKNSQMDLFTTPANTLYSHYMFVDKNNEVCAYMQYGQQKSGTDFIGLFIHEKNKSLHGIMVTNSKELLPAGNNTYSLGSVSHKWSNAHIDKTYANRVNTYSIAHPNDDSYLFMCGGSDFDKGAALYLGGISATNFTPGRFVLVARRTNATFELTGSPNGSLTWGGKNIALDENLVHRTGNETINGIKTFNNSVTVCENVTKKNNLADRSVTPTSFIGTNFLFSDKNDAVMGYLNHSQRTTGESDVGIYVRDKNDVDYGFRVTTNKELLPVVTSTYNLGSVSYKWANVYTNNIHTSNIDTKYITHTHDAGICTLSLPERSGTLAIQERTRASAVVENRTLLYECAGGLDLGDITLNDVYTKFNALLIVYSDDDGDYMSTHYLDCAELDIRREVAGSGTFLLVDGHSYWACTGASTGSKFVHATNKGLRIHKIYGLAKYY